MTSCDYAAPLFAYETGYRQNVLLQGCCNHWDCKRCGILRAKEEYGRIVQGAKEIALNQELWFITLTCRGRQLNVADAEENYLEWTNRFLDAARIKARRLGQAWYYVQVTERQKRGHPHSHILTVFHPHDEVASKRTKWRTDNAGKRIYEQVELLRSDWLSKEVVRAGLGSEYDISSVRSVEAASRYVAKYMFKSCMFTVWPKGWKRVRYSQSWPKLPEMTTDAVPVLTDRDLINLAIRSETIICKELEVFQRTENAIRKVDLPYELAHVSLKMTSS